MIAMPFMQSDLGILNAEEYNFGLGMPGSRPRRGTKRQLSFNLRESGTSTGASDPPSNTEDDIVSPSSTGKSNKRKGGKENGREDDKERKRSRGRPRIDVTDVTAADRRRTQIRLAQRAYRNRKENAIVTLEKKVKSLVETNEAMSNAFMSLHDYAISHGMLEENPEFAQHLHRTTETFLELARQSSAEEDDNEDEDGGASKSMDSTQIDRASSTLSPAQQLQTSSGARPGVFGYSIQRNSESPEIIDRDPKFQQQQQQQPLYGGLIVDQVPATDDGIDYPRQAMFFENMNFSGSSDGSSGMATSSEASPYQSTSPAGQVTTATSTNAATATSAGPNSFSHMLLDSTGFSFFTAPPQQSPGFTSSNTHAAQAHAQIQAAAVAASLGSPYASISLPRSFATFGLRLRRMALEKAYALAINPNPPPELFARAFGFCVIFDSLDTIRKRLRARMEHPGSLGGTATWHLPYVSKVLGESPSTQITGINVDDIASATHRALKLDPEVEIIMPSFAGSFFDAEETEIYLRQRGVEIPPNSERLVVEVDADDFGGGRLGRRNNATDLGSQNVHDRHAGRADVSSNSRDNSNNDIDSNGISSTSIEALANVQSFDFSSYNSGHSAQPEWDAVSARTGITTGSNSSGTTGSSFSGAAGAQISGDDLITSLMSGNPIYGGGQTGNTPASILSYGSTSDAAGSPTGFKSGRRSTSPSRRRLVTLDVNRFVHELVMRGTCLGKYPGFRPVDVNDAFWTAARITAA